MSALSFAAACGRLRFCSCACVSPSLMVLRWRMASHSTVAVAARDGKHVGISHQHVDSRVLWTLNTLVFPKTQGLQRSASIYCLTEDVHAAVVAVCLLWHRHRLKGACVPAYGLRQLSASVNFSAVEPIRQKHDASKPSNAVMICRASPEHRLQLLSNHLRRRLVAAAACRVVVAVGFVATSEAEQRPV